MSTPSPDADGSSQPDQPDRSADDPRAGAHRAPDRPAVERASQRNGLGVGALVVGVLAVLTFWSIVGGILFGTAAAIMGSFAARRINRGRATNRGAALGGIVTGVLAVIASVAFLSSGLSSLSGSFFV